MTRHFLLGCLLAAACGGVQSQPPPPQVDAGPVDALPPLEPLSAWLSISDVAMFQGPRAPIFVNGADIPKTLTPVIADRPGMMRVYLKMLEKRTKAHHLQAELHVTSGGSEVAVAHDDGFISGDSVEDQVDSGFKFAIDPGILKTDSTYTMIVRDPDLKLAADAPEATLVFPADGSALPFHADATAPEIKINFVPVQYNADKSGRLPDTSVNQITRFHDTLYRMYPAAKITTTVAAPLPFSTVIDPSGPGWDTLVQALIDRRAADNANDDVYYIALFATTGTFNEYCSNGCIGGVGLPDGAVDPNSRVAVVAGYPVQFASDTLNQELAHSMGREHAPCGNPGGIDPKFPYKDGRPGIWGYDVIKSRWVDPLSGVADFMSYCHPIWVSDYTYSALYRQMRYVQKTKTQKSVVPPQSMRVVRILPDGSTRDAGSMRVSAPSQEISSTRVELLDAAGGVVIATDRFISLDKLGGGLALVPEHTSTDAIVQARQAK